MFDSKSNRAEQPDHPHQGDRIVNVDSSVDVPTDARVIDLGSTCDALIDAHVHVVTGGATPAQRALIALANAQIDLEAGFTTVLDMDRAAASTPSSARCHHRPGQGPRMQVVSQSINQRHQLLCGSQSVPFLDEFTEKKNTTRRGLRAPHTREQMAASVEDLHHPGFRRPCSHVEVGRYAGQQPVIDVRGSRGDRG
jgi:hypothetical protein